MTKQGESLSSCYKLKSIQQKAGEEGWGWGAHVCLWRIHFGVWQNQYNIIKLKKKRKADFGET